jgi:hypothetical protein
VWKRQPTVLAYLTGISHPAMFAKSCELANELLDNGLTLSQARGAHGISLTASASISGDVELAEMIFSRRATTVPAYLAWTLPSI